MAAQLDILALEPFYGGVRRSMLEAVIRCSRHRWTLLRLPPRRIERRLTAAAHWFAEQLTRHWVGKTDLLFTSEAMNLPDLFRMMPALSKKPSIVYFHGNQLPPVGSTAAESPLDIVNLASAMAGSETWFNSKFHLKQFLRRASAMCDKHPELSSRNPMRALTAKAHVLLTPTDFDAVHQALAGPAVERDPRVMFVDTRDADASLLNYSLSSLQDCGEKFSLITVGPAEALLPQLPRTTLQEKDEMAQMRAMRQAGIFLSAKPEAAYDRRLVQAMASGCWPVAPSGGCYPEILPESFHETTLYEPTIDGLCGRVQTSWYMNRPPATDEWTAAYKRFDPIVTCKAIDERIESLAAAGPGARE